MRTALFGGTFDPVHIGHLMMADEVLHRLSYERIRFVPAHVAPHKAQEPCAGPDDRLAMLRLATAEREEFVVDPWEIEHGEVSYTIRTLRHLLASGDVTERPGLIIGEDLVDGFDRWREADEIERLADLVLVRRPGAGAPRFGRRHQLVDNVPIPISATGIRERVRKGLPYRYLVTAEVYGYIRHRRLYQPASADR